MKVIAYKEDMVLETNGVCAEGMNIEKLGFIIQAIPLEKVKQAKLEAEDIRELTKDGWKTPRELKEEFIAIMDKLIAESEG